MAGEDDEETELLAAMGREALAYLERQPWCASVADGHFGAGIGGAVAAFLFQVAMRHGEPPATEWLWVVCGDLPPMYLVADALHDPVDVIRAYCDLASDWVNAARRGGDLTTAFPVGVEPTAEHVSMLASRIAFVRGEIIPELEARAAMG